MAWTDLLPEQQKQQKSLWSAMPVGQPTVAQPAQVPKPIVSTGMTKFSTGPVQQKSSLPDSLAALTGGYKLPGQTSEGQSLMHALPAGPPAVIAPATPAPSVPTTPTAPSGDSDSAYYTHPSRDAAGRPIAPGVTVPELLPDHLRMSPPDLSSWLALQKEQQATEEQRLRDRAIGRTSSGIEEAKTNIAMRGGLRGGAQERLETAGAETLNKAQQEIASHGVSQRQILDLAKMEKDIQNEINSAKFNIDLAIQEGRRKDAAAWSEYVKMMEEWAADRMASAMAAQRSGGLFSGGGIGGAGDWLMNPFGNMATLGLGDNSLTQAFNLTQPGYYASQLGSMLGL